jgi:methionine-rich copper-binding protein CopC
MRLRDSISDLASAPARRFAYTGTATRIGISALLGAFAALAALAAPATSFAHARYVSSDPTANAVLKAAPSVVTIHFAEAIKPEGSDIIVYDATGKAVSTGPAQVDRADLKTMHVNMQGNDSEVYVVVWHNVSLDDGDPDAGSFTFNVSATGSTSTNTSPATTSSSSGGVPVWLTVLIGLVGVAVGAGGMVLARRQAK